MKILKITLTTLILFASAFALKAQVNSSQTYVSAYFRADGSYVPAHYKTDPNVTNRDNFTTKPNVNPYTAKPGYISPDSKGLSSGYYPTRSTYTPSTGYTLPSSNTIYTGSKGGQYYINSSGNRTYIKH